MKFLFLLLTILAFTCSKTENKVHIAICENGNGCEFATTSLSQKEINQLLNKPNLLNENNPATILVLDKCDFRVENSLTEEDLDKSYGGTGQFQTIDKFDFKEYLKKHNCFTEPESSDCIISATQKVSFYANTSEDGEFSGFYYINFKEMESFMPNEVFQKMMKGEASEGVVDQFFRKNSIDTYMIMEGKKIHSTMPVGYGSDGGNHYFNSNKFEKEFKKTGKTKPHFDGKNQQVEYTGKDSEGGTISLWLTPAKDICLPKGESFIWGFYNMGYITLNNTVYLVAELSGTNYQLKITGVSEGSYQFNPQGFETHHVPMY